MDEDSQPFSGETIRVSALTPVETLAIRQREHYQQREDAARRHIVWDADGLTDTDAEGDDDPDYIGLAKCTPLGIRQENGSVIPLAKVEDLAVGGDASMDVNVAEGADDPQNLEKAEFAGAPESIPSDVEGLVSILVPFHPWGC